MLTEISSRKKIRSRPNNVVVGILTRVQHHADQDCWITTEKIRVGGDKMATTKKTAKKKKSDGPRSRKYGCVTYNSEP